MARVCAIQNEAVSERNPNNSASLTSITVSAICPIGLRTLSVIATSVTPAARARRQASTVSWAYGGKLTAINKSSSAMALTCSGNVPPAPLMCTVRRPTRLNA
ncbi:hypothetical protein D3C76_1304110 [compost metagenome]